MSKDQSQPAGELPDTKHGKPPLIIAEQGSYFAGGTVLDVPGELDLTRLISDGGTRRVDHAYVRYQRPVNPRALALVMWHGGAQFMKTWEMTPDGREGFDSLLLRRDWEVHLMDQPRRGGASASGSDQPARTRSGTDEAFWAVFRVGIYPNPFPEVQFPTDPESLDQFWRQQVEDVGPEDQEVVTSAGSAIFDRIGPGVLITHSQSGKWGFLTAIRNTSVKAVTAMSRER